MAEVDSCVQPAAGLLDAEPALAEQAHVESASAAKEDVSMAVASVGKKAPNFEAPAYVAGEGFKNVKLSDYEGQWVVLCFYPGDFTFV
jgi:hypothetical protein